MSSAHPLTTAEFSPHQLRSAYLSATFVSLLVMAFGLTTALGGGMWGLLVIGVAFAPYAFSQPKVGLWLSLALIMVASLIAPPAGFEYGIGYSPELPYWAVATCIVFAALLFRYFYVPASDVDRNASLPASFRAFVAVVVFSGLLGIVRLYSVLNVAKQFYGCLLFCAYFLFAVRF